MELIMIKKKGCMPCKEFEPFDEKRAKEEKEER